MLARGIDRLPAAGNTFSRPLRKHDATRPGRTTFVAHSGLKCVSVAENSVAAVSTSAPDAVCSSRRFALVAGVVGLTAAGVSFVGAPSASAAARGFGSYIKKRQLDPLETYIPLVLEAKLQLSEAGIAMEKDAQLAKSLLREGAFSGLRDNVRAIGEYAEKEGRTTDASGTVTGFFRSLEALDLLLANAVRSGELDLPAAQEALKNSEAALDAVIALVPEAELQKGQRVLDIILEKARSFSTAADLEEVDPAAALEDIRPLLP